MPEEQGGRERLNHIKGMLALLLFIGTDIYRVYEQEIVHVLKKPTHAEKILCWSEEPINQHS